MRGMTSNNWKSRLTMSATPAGFDALEDSQRPFPQPIFAAGSIQAVCMICASDHVTDKRCLKRAQAADRLGRAVNAGIRDFDSRPLHFHQLTPSYTRTPAYKANSPTVLSLQHLCPYTPPNTDSSNYFNMSGYQPKNLEDVVKFQQRLLNDLSRQNQDLLNKLEDYGDALRAIGHPIVMEPWRPRSVYANANATGLLIKPPTFRDKCASPCKRNVCKYVHPDQGELYPGIIATLPWHADVKQAGDTKPTCATPATNSLKVVGPHVPRCMQAPDEWSQASPLHLPRLQVRSL
jgi:hypothetical protein